MKLYTRVLAVTLALVAILAAACSGGDDGGFNGVIEVGGDELTPVIASSELVVGPNRFAAAVLGPDGAPIVDGRVTFRFFYLNGANAEPRGEVEGVSRVPARDAGLQEEIVHTHSDGSRHVHINAGDEIGIYTANVEFDRAGDWGVEIDIEADSPKVKETLRPRFNVIAQSVTPAIGAQAPRSRNLTVNDVQDIAQIDTSANPGPLLHTSTIADAIASGKPTLVLFAVPGFCTSRLCGPELEIMRKLYPKYEGKAEFIHVEFYKNPGTPQATPVEAVLEWGLRSEPWFFLIDGQGRIAAKFDGPTAMAELDEALQKVMGGAASAP